ncbi:MAG: polysaccharide deacetylase family protein [Chitinophagaceae bacterium]
MKKKFLFIFGALLIVFSVSFIANAYIILKEPGVIVLLYHRVTDNVKDKSKYNVNVQQFEHQLDLISKNNFITILPKEIFQNNHFNNKEILLILSFDDGTEDHYHSVFPRLKKYDMKGIFFVVTKYINSDANLTDHQIQEMSRNQMEIGSHSYSHPYLNDLSQGNLEYELERSKKDLEAIVGGEIISFAPPGGWFKQGVLSAAKKAGYKAFFSCEIGRTSVEPKPFLFRRIEVLGEMTDEEFLNLLRPEKILKYKIQQEFKFMIHDLIGFRLYKKMGEYFKLFSPQPY